jgi:outer membrane protein OmpA-like peptidoglycan-associated protein
MKRKGDNFFWASFSDLMTSLFFIVLVLYVVTYISLKKKEKFLIELNNELEQKLAVYNLVEENLKPLKQDTLLIRYEQQYKRFTLAFDVTFEIGKTQIKDEELKNYFVTASKIQSVGRQLQRTMDNLVRDIAQKPELKNVSYLLIISGYASRLQSANQREDYDLSYQRAYNLWAYWKDIGIDFETDKYKGLIDLQIAGNGWGGVGRFERDPQNFMENETKNQRFIIQIVPKIGNTNLE